MNKDGSGPTVATALARAIARLAPAPGAPLDAQLLLSHVLGRARSALLAGSEDVIPVAAIAEFERTVERRAGGEPVAYITGRREFWSLELRVSPSVLVPRPETELVVERALALLPATGAELADLGTGSGAIALALGRERTGWHITATDLLQEALAVAIGNATALAITNVHFLQGDWFQPLEGLRFSLIASNPPYIAAADPAMADPALRHEPRAALTSGATGMEALATIIEGAPAHLHPDGYLVLEHGATQAEELAVMLVARGFRHVRCHTDLAGLPRVTEAQWLAADINTQPESPSS